MSQINFNTSIGGIGSLDRLSPTCSKGVNSTGQKFGDVLKASIDEVNRLQADAENAMKALQTGKTDNVAEVMTAVNKAGLAFDMLLQIRNKLLDAYNDVRNMRI